MTIIEINKLVAMIKAYYPMKPMFTTPLEVGVWKQAFSDDNADEVIEATKFICETDSTGSKLTVGGIKNKMKEIKEKKRRAEEKRKMLEPTEEYYDFNNPERKKMARQIQEFKKYFCENYNVKYEEYKWEEKEEV